MAGGRSGKTVGLLVLSVAALGYVAWTRLGPQQRGIHSTVIEAQTKAATQSGPRIGGCPLFPADNVWNTPIDHLPKDPKTAAYVESIGPLKKVHPDFGANLGSGIPYTDVPSGTPGAKVTFEYREESDPGSYPVFPGAPIEGGGGDDGDRHMILVDQRRCLLYELFAVQVHKDGSWTAGSGIKMDLTSNALRGDGKTSGDAAGLPILPGLIRYEEVESGHIDHALRFTIPKTQSAYVWPARHKASSRNDVNLPPLGVRFRLRADFDISKYSKPNQVIMTALKRYGFFLADNGSAMYLSGVSDRRWSDDDLHKLGSLLAEDFEAVDESSLQLLPDSGRVDPLALKR